MTVQEIQEKIEKVANEYGELNMTVAHNQGAGYEFDLEAVEQELESLHRQLKVLKQSGFNSEAEMNAHYNNSLYGEGHW